MMEFRGRVQGFRSQGHMPSSSFFRGLCVGVLLKDWLGIGPLKIFRDFSWDIRALVLVQTSVGISKL